MKTILLFISLFIAGHCYSQYIGVTAKYTETRLVDNPGHAPSRENRLVLSFYTVSALGLYTPVSLSNYDVYIWMDGLQYGGQVGGVLDSVGNNYPGYEFTAPRVVSSWNTYNYNYIDCNPFLVTHFAVNGSQLDCGFVRVSTWEWDEYNQRENEFFNAPNICLPYYQWPHAYYNLPGNLNFKQAGEGIYNNYNFMCAGSTLEFALRGILPQDEEVPVIFLPVRFANENASINVDGRTSISWSNLTESGIMKYTVEKSVEDKPFAIIETILPTNNNDTRADYQFESMQTESKALYRIKALENGGGIFYSAVMSVKKQDQVAEFLHTKMIVYPNPTSGDNFTFRVNNAAPGRYVCSVITPEGKNIRQKLVMHNGGDLTRVVDLSGLPAGSYQVLLLGEGTKYSERILYVH